MCIIAAKPVGVEMPEARYIRNMFSNNPDGAGFMYAYKGKVNIEKGFMTEWRFTQRLEELDDEIGLKNVGMVMHFRITTHGGTKPENCHPFPISDSMGMLKKLKSHTDVGVAHNGIIDIKPRSKDISDTMEYIAGQLAPLKRAVRKFYKNKDLMQMVYNAIDSKMCIMDSGGNMYFIGDFMEDKGIKYSNMTYMYGNTWRDFPYSSEYYGFNEEAYYETRKLMLLNEDKGEYVITKKGTLLMDNFALDKNNTVYYYDYETDLYIETEGATAYSSAGIPLKYNEDSEMVSTELVLKEWIYE